MSHSFDLQAYIAEHKDPEARSRSFSVGDYAYRADIKWLRTLHALVPVRLLLGATGKLWSGWGRKQVLEDAVRSSEKDASRVYGLARTAARMLHMAPVQVYVTPHLKEVPAAALGDEGEQFVAVHAEAVRAFDDTQLLFLLGRELGHVQNGHVRYTTAWFYADEVAGGAVKAALTPALTALTRWYRLATITADRAGLLACRDLEAARRQIVRQSLARARMHEDVDVDAVLGELERADQGQGLLERLLQRQPAVRIRLDALSRFTESRFWRDHVGQAEPGGLTLSEVDDAIEVLITGRQARSRESE